MIFRLFSWGEWNRWETKAEQGFETEQLSKQKREISPKQKDRQIKNKSFFITREKREQNGAPE
jgi:hypothetical protein